MKRHINIKFQFTKSRFLKLIDQSSRKKNKMKEGERKKKEMVRKNGMKEERIKKERNNKM